MSPTEERELHALGADLAAARQSGREPRCVARAFSAPVLPFTMQAWIGLAAIDSPLLRDELPGDFDELNDAAGFFALALEPLDAEEAILVAKKMLQAVQDAFAMALAMRPEESSPAADDGFGTWLPIFCALIDKCHMSPASALQLAVGQAFAILAGINHNRGWHVTGTPYALRDVDSGLSTIHSQPSTSS